MTHSIPREQAVKTPSAFPYWQEIQRSVFLKCCDSVLHTCREFSGSLGVQLSPDGLGPTSVRD